MRRLMLRAVSGGVDLGRIAADDAALRDFVRETVFGVWHASGTCRMGDSTDRGAVVDPTGRVIGVEGLSVADASVMPSLPSANTNVPTIMIGEKIADHLVAQLGAGA
nr:GMC oxidoreductase [Methylobacterium aquaticum]